ncbi:hypothetical protein PGB90_009586 [Kerria lacca]
MSAGLKIGILAITLLPYPVISEYLPQLLTSAAGGCRPPELTLNGTSVVARQNASPDYSTLTEIKFTAQMPIPTGQHNRKILCKLKCVNHDWIGPLCAEVEDENGRFHPVLRNCRLDLNGTNLILIYENTTLPAWHGWLPDRSKILLRCNGPPGKYKFLGHSNLQCMDGDWDYEIPSCIPTTSITGYNETSPPTILVRLPNGSSSIDMNNNHVIIYPGSIVHLECLFKRRDGNPEWSWSTGQQHRLTGWAIAADEREWIYRMSIFYIKREDSGDYTCTTPKGMRNTITIRIDPVQCEKRDGRLLSKYLVVQSEGNHIGQKINYSCSEGFILNGTNASECLANGKWSSNVPTCEPIVCPPIETTNPHLIVSESNSTFGGEIVFRCQWGYVLQGTKKIYCQVNGRWSASVPTCLETICSIPVVPLNGRMIEVTNSGKYNVGTIVQYTCNKGHQLIGAETIICEENGTWSNSPPYCKALCGYPGEPLNGRVVPLKFWYEPGDRLKVVCEPGYVTPDSVFVVCKSDGRWSVDVPHCINYTEV